MIIRSAELNDRDRLFELLQQFAISRVPSKEVFEQNYPQALADPDVFLRVAELDGQIIGYSLAILQWTFYANGRVMLLQELMVDEKFRGQGYGSKLLENAIADAKSADATEISLFTSRAPDYYPRFGFEQKASYFRLKLR
jgi:N-acetylglutamate synthase-like GNAT family acetyltransferase